MKDIQKIKEFFSKPLNEGNKEYFKPLIRKDKSNPNFLFVDITYPEGSDVLSVGGSKTMGGQDREEGAAKALTMGNNIAKKLEAKYNIEDIEVKDLKNGKVEVFAVSDDFIKMASPSLDEAKESKKEDVLGDWISDMLKYKSYEEVKRILLNNLRDALMDDELVAKIKKEKNINEAQEEDKVDTITMDVPLFIRMLEYSREDAAADVDLHDVTEKAISLNKEKDILSMDDYNEIVGAAEEIEEGFYGKGDKRRGLQNTSKLSSAEYQMAKKLKSFKASDWKWNADEDLYNKVNEVELTEANVPSNIKEFAKRKGVSSLVNKVAGWAERVGKRIAGGTAVGKNYSTLVLDLDYQQNGEIRINTDDETVTLYDEPVNSFPEFKRVYLDDQDDTIEEGVGNDLDEPYFIEVSVRDARKAMDMFDDMYRRSNIKTYGSNVYAASTPEDIYDLYYDLNNQGIEILDYNVDGDLDEATDYMKRRQTQNDYAVSKKDKPAKSTNPNTSGDTDYMKRRKKELAEAILTKLKK